METCLKQQKLQKAYQVSEDFSKINKKTQLKNNYEHIWKKTLFCISIVSSILFHKIYLYQTSAYFKDVRKGNLFELILYGIPFGLIFIYLENLVHAILDKKCNLYYLSYQKYQTEQARKKRCYSLVKWGYSLIFYMISSISSYFILKQTSFLPSWLGGSGECTNLMRYLTSLDEANIYMKIYYILQFGKHLGRFFQHVFIKSQGSFYQYALHHGLSTFLILFSYLMNMWIIGIFVLFIHDLSDFIFISARAYRDYKHYNKIIVKILYFTAISTWIICRNFLLSYCCVYSSFNTAYQFYKIKQLYPPEYAQVLFMPGVFMGFMLLSLQILQIFWTYYVIKAVIQVIISPKLAKNTYE